MKLSERLIDPSSPDRRPRRAAYALPSLFTAGNVFLGFYSLMETYQAAMRMAQGGDRADVHFQTAAISIGVAVVLDGLDGTIARMTNTVTEFGRELDSLADVITFGLAPAVLGFAWGIQFADPFGYGNSLELLRRAGYFIAFIYLICGAARLARFNIQKNPVPKNPGRPDRKYFVGLPIPAPAAVVAGVVYAADGDPLHWWILSAAWMALLGLLAFLMVSTWRYPSPKGLSLSRPRSPLIVILLAGVVYLVYNFPQPMLLGLSACYIGSGILIRVGGVLRRRMRPNHPEPEHQIG